MFSDVFSKQQALNLLQGKRVWFIGSSNMRAIYKDVLWLVTHESLAFVNSFKIKNEPSYLNDKRLSNDNLHNGRNYKEIREFKNDKIHLYFHFITRLYLDHFVELINSITPDNYPHVILINSCLWDLTRWGPDGPKCFKRNLLKTMKFLKSKLPPETKIIWKTTLPVSTSANGAIFIDEIKYIVPMLPWHILEANFYASTCANFFNFDILDLHHYMRLQGHLRVKDGIHWTPLAIRYLTNAFLTHIALAWNVKLPGNFKPNGKFLTDTSKEMITECKLVARVNKKAGFFKRLFEKTENAVKKTQHHLQQGIKNRTLTIKKRILRPAANIKNKLKNFAHNFSRNRNTVNMMQQNNQYNFVQHNNTNFPQHRNNFPQHSNNFPQHNLPQPSFRNMNVNINYNSPVNNLVLNNNYNQNLRFNPLPQYNNLAEFLNNDYFVKQYSQPYNNYRW